MPNVVPKLQQKIQQLMDQMSENFCATNKLSRYLKQMRKFWNSSWYKWIAASGCWCPRSTSTQDSAICKANWWETGTWSVQNYNRRRHKHWRQENHSKHDAHYCWHYWCHTIAGVVLRVLQHLQLLALLLEGYCWYHCRGILLIPIAGAIAGAYETGVCY